MRTLIFDYIILFIFSLIIFRSNKIALFFKCSNYKIFDKKKEYFNAVWAIFFLIMVIFAKEFSFLSLMILMLSLLIEKLDRYEFIGLSIFLFISIITTILLENKMPIFTIYIIKAVEYIFMIISLIFLLKMKLVKGKPIIQ